MKCLLLVDVQNDFLPGGALAVPDGDQIVPVANALIARFSRVVATKDWHPPGHGSFVSQHPGHKIGDVVPLNGLPQTLWPDHCVQNTPGAAFPAALDAGGIDRVFFKGTDPGVDSYSGFFDNGRRRATGLAAFLQQSQVAELYVMGLATDYCVRFTVLDALELGFRVFLIEDGVRGVNLQPKDAVAATAEMRRAGATVIGSGRVAGSDPTGSDR